MKRPHLLGSLLIYLAIQAVRGTVLQCREDPADPDAKAENNTCAVENVIPLRQDPPHGNQCLEIVGDLILENIQSPAEVEHIWNITKVTGRIVVKNTQLETIDFEKLCQVSYNDDYPAVIIMGNKKLKTLKFGRGWKVDFARQTFNGNSTRYMVVVDNGAYRMSKLEHIKLKRSYRSSEQSRFLVDVEQTRNMDNEELDFEKSELALVGVGAALIPMAIVTAGCYCWIEQVKL